MSTTSELTHLFRALKAPAAARALPKLAERARAEDWSYERFAEALLSTEHATREAHGGEGRIKAARFPARKTLEEFDFTFQRSVKKTLIQHLGQLDFLHGRENVVLLGPPGTGKTPPLDRPRDPRLPGRPARRLPHRHRMGRAARRRPTPRPPRRRAHPAAADPAADRRRGRLHPVRPPGRQPDVHARQPPLRARLDDRHLQQAVLGLGRDLRRRRRRRRDDRPARPPRRDRRAQRRQLPPTRPRPRPPHQQTSEQNSEASPNPASPATPARSPRSTSKGVHFQPAQRGASSTGLDRSLGLQSSYGGRDVSVPAVRAAGRDV